MGKIIDSKKDPNSYACRHNFGGVYIGGKFMKDGTSVSREIYNSMTKAQKERYVRENNVKQGKKKSPPKK